MQMSKSVQVPEEIRWVTSVKIDKIENHEVVSDLNCTDYCSCYMLGFWSAFQLGSVL